MARVELDGVRKVFDNGFVAVHDASFIVEDGEFVVLVGPSGCGKSTTLRMIAGLEAVTAGVLRIGDRVVNAVPPRDRDVAMVFQHYALYPHMSVFDNMAFGLRLRKYSKDEIRRRVGQAAALLGLDEVLDRRPRQLSGGQRQRVALGRALVRKPAVYLFDEPLSNLDARLRVQMRMEIARLHRQIRTTTIYVTHDQVEAMTLGDRIVVLSEGRIQQIDTPLNLYHHPANQFVAGFIGNPSMNFVPGRVGAEGRFVADGGAFELVPVEGLLPHAGETVTLGVRPEALYAAGTAPPGQPVTPVEVIFEAAEQMGNEMVIYGRIRGHPLVARVAPGPLPEPGEPLRLDVDRSRLHYFDAGTGAALRLAPAGAPSDPAR